jgi:rhodanese-related sulfurtransferase
VRRILVIAAGEAGLRAATRIKRRLSEHEVNVIIPAAAGKALSSFRQARAGQEGAMAFPDLEAVASRGVGVLEAEDIMPDLGQKEILARSARGQLPVRYTDLVVEVPARARIPRGLRTAGNVFGWPRTDFGADGAALDAALAGAASSGLPVLVAGRGMEALEALFWAVATGASALWVRTSEQDVPGLDPLLTAQVLLRLARAGATVQCVPLPEAAADRLDLRLTDDGSRALALRLPEEGEEEGPEGAIRDLPVSCVILTAPLLASHPLLREEGVLLDASGRITLGEDFPEDAGLVLMGGGAALPGAKQGRTGLRFPAWTGGEETAQVSAWLAVDKVTGEQGPADAGCGVFGIRRALAPGLRFFRAGFWQEEARARGLEVEYAVAGLSGAESSLAAAGPCPIGTRRPAGAASTGTDAAGSADRLLHGESLLVLSLLCERSSRALVGVQVLGCGRRAAEADALFGMAVTALAEGVHIDALARRDSFVGAAGLTAIAAGIARNKLHTGIRGITPEEYLASREAGAEFFTLDLRSLSEWRAGHIPGAHSLPLTQLKKRLQNEVPRYMPLVLASTDGREAYAAACRLAGLGATDLYVLDGGMLLWPYALERETDRLGTL